MRTDPSVATGEQRPTNRGRPRLSRTRQLLIGSTLAVYVAVVVGVLTTSWLVQLDWQVMLFRPYKQWPQFHALLDVVVVLGQRGPTALIVLAWLIWRSSRQRDLRPLLVLGLALLLLNVSVGAVKYGLGRLGPHYATSAGSAELFAGGDIFPSGHTANAVVTWGVLAYLATKHRRTGAVITAVFAFTVGMTTIYLGTHWVTDVIAGWTAGVLVMLFLPMFEPFVAQADLRIRALWRRITHLGRPAPITPSPIAARGPAPLTPQLAGEDGPDYGRTRVGAAAGHRAPAAAASTAVVTAPVPATTTGPSAPANPKAAAAGRVAAEPHLHHPTTRGRSGRFERPAGTAPPATRRTRPEVHTGRSATPLGAREGRPG